MELVDYGGEYKPDLKLQDFSKRAVMKLAEIGAKDTAGIDAFWFSMITERYGLDTARELERKVWIGKNSFAVVQDMKRIVSAFNIKGNDISCVLKYIQVSPIGGTGGWKYEADIKDKNRVIVTVTDCPSIDYFERRDDMEGAKFTFSIDVGWFNTIARYFNSKIKIRCLNECPRKSKHEVPCRWEFKLE